jgi:hypothetical protein
MINYQLEWSGTSVEIRCRPTITHLLKVFHCIYGTIPHSFFFFWKFHLKPHTFWNHLNYIPNLDNFKNTSRLTLFWILAPCRPVHRIRRFGETYHLHLLVLKSTRLQNQDYDYDIIINIASTHRAVGGGGGWAERRSRKNSTISKLFLSSEEGSSKFLRNVGIYRPVYTAPTSWRTSRTTPWKSRISL